MGPGLGHVTIFTFWDHLYISGIDKAREFKFGVRIDL